MAALVVFSMTVTDPEGYEEYRLLGQATVRRFGGRVLSGEPPPRGICEPLEGDSAPGRVVVAEFPSVEVAREWYKSDQYQQASKMRWRTTNPEWVVLVEGWSQEW